MTTKLTILLIVLVALTLTGCIGMPNGWNATYYRGVSSRDADTVAVGVSGPITYPAWWVATFGGPK